MKTITNDDIIGMDNQPESIKTLKNILQTEPIPKNFEITILPIYNDVESTTTNDDSSTVSLEDCFMKVDTHLGIHAPTLPLLAREFRKEYYFLRRQKKILHHEDTQQQQQAINTGTMQQRMLDATQCLLLVCPDNATAWADRRRLMPSMLSNDDVHKIISLFENEIQFLNLLFSQHSKAPNSWSHRKWVCRNLIHFVFENKKDMIGTFYNDNKMKWDYVMNNWTIDEINICTSIAERYPKNYYAWTHRIFVIQTIINQRDVHHSQMKESTKATKSNGQIDKDRTNGETTMNVKNIEMDILQLLQNEIHFIEKWLQSHISDHSAAHYGGQVMDIYLQLLSDTNIDNNEAKTIPNLVHIGKEICTNCKSLISSYPQKEVLWIWKRICSRFFIRIISHELQKEKYNKSTTILNELLQNYIFKDITAILHEHKESGVTSSNDVDKNAYNVHSLTYIVWIMRQIKIYQVKDDSPNLPKSLSLQMLDLNENYDIQELESCALRQLSINDNICYNTWRLSCATT